MQTAVKERPILFSGPMVRAILDGRKTQTRRICKPQPEVMYEYKDRPDLLEFLHPVTSGTYSRKSFAKMCKYGFPGDRLWVRETWGLMDTQPSDGPDNAVLGYRADGEHNAPNGRYQLWRPSIHMPRWASRITLEITDVRVQRLQDISEGDSEAEGVERIELSPGPDFGSFHGIPMRGHPMTSTYRLAFEKLWESINGPGSWEKNSWVWAISFRRIEQ